MKNTEVLIVETPALVTLACRSTLFQTILAMHVVLLAQILIFQHFVRAIDAQKFLVCIVIILLAETQTLFQEVRQHSAYTQLQLMPNH